MELSKPPRPGAVPNLDDYEQIRRKFTWDAARAELDGLPGDAGLNIAHEAVERHATGPLADVTALRWLGKHGERRDFTYRELAAAARRFAGVLTGLGVRRGERVFVLAGRLPELYIAALGTLRHGAVFSPLFAAFGPEPIHTRMSLGDGRVLVTTRHIYERKVADLRATLPGLRHVLLIGEGHDDPLPGTLDLAAQMAASADAGPIAATDPEDMALLHFTSGTTGKPKGAIHVHAAVIMHHIAGRYALDLRPGDIYWCTADPGWVTGTSFGIIAPLTNGVTMIVDEAEFDSRRWYGILEAERVNIWYTAPTAIRMLMRQPIELPRAHDLGRLRLVASVGEPLNPEAVLWGQEALGLPIHDNWWQTETGGIMIANFLSMPIRPGSMGKPLPGIEASIVERRADGTVAVIDAPDREGELAIRTGWPSMFRGYLGNEERYRTSFSGGWYLSGDLARRDADGYFWFVGRADDVIKTSGHLVGPFEVESALMEHPAIVEAAVIGKPDPVAGAIVKAFVVVRPGHPPGPELLRDVMAFARRRLGPAVAPREIDFTAELPRTRSGKIMRRLLRARELGLPEGDTSTLEQGA